MLKHVWINLIDNALKFVPRCGTVELEVSDIGDGICVKVSNTGSEIPLDKREKIPVIADDEKVFVVFGFGSDCRFCDDGGSGYFIKIDKK